MRRAFVVSQDSSIYSSIIAVEAHWISQFWVLKNVVFDPAFENTEFTNWLSQDGISADLITPKRHNKNARVKTPNHSRYNSASQIRDKGSNNLSSAYSASNQDINGLYGNDFVSAHELQIGDTRPVLKGQTPIAIPYDILALKVTRELNLILQSKSTKNPPISPGNEVEV